MSNGTILVVEDNAHIRKFIVKNLLKQGYKAYEAETLKGAYYELKNNVIDLVLLDLYLGKNDGMEILRTIRRQNDILPVIIVSSITNVSMKIHGFEVGCDDYITKPFYIEELLCRVKRLLSRIRAPHLSNSIITEKIQSGPFVLDVKKFTLTKKDRVIPLRKKLFDLMLFFVCNPETIITKENLFERAWDFEDGMNSNNLYVHINELRKKIEDRDTKSHYIKNIRNVGYFYSPNKFK